MTIRTITFDDEQWQVVPRVATQAMGADCAALAKAGEEEK